MDVELSMRGGRPVVSRGEMRAQDDDSATLGRAREPRGVYAWGRLLLCAGAVGCGEGDLAASPLIDAAARANPNSTLAAFVDVETRDATRVSVRFTDAMGFVRQTSWTREGTSHTVPVVGMRAESAYELEVLVRGDASSAEEIASLTTLPFETGALPPDTRLPTVVETAAGAQPEAFTLLGPGRRPTLSGPGPSDEPYMIALDGEGEVVWYYQEPEALSNFLERDMHQLPSGDLLVQMPTELRIINVAGEVLQTFRPDDPSLELHHDSIPLASGGVLGLTRQDRTVQAPSQGGEVVVTGDGLIEWNAAGDVVWTWSAFDHLDVDRFPGPLSESSSIFAGGALDWTHGNGLFERVERGSYLVSLRHQNWIIDVDRASGAVNWRLGPGGDFTLEGEGIGDVEWFYSQHAPSIVTGGELLLYDNGNERPQAPDSYSRAVRLRLDEVAMTAEQTWSFRTDEYTPYLGDAWATPDGTVLVCAGGVLGDAPLAELVEVSGQGGAEPNGWSVAYGADAVVYRARRIESFYPGAD